MNFGAHVKFVNKELDKLEAEEKKEAAVTKLPSTTEAVVDPEPEVSPATATEQPGVVAGVA